MKKIFLLFFAFFLSFSAYSQFPTPGIEGFENTTGPDIVGTGTSPWTLGTGAPGNQWAVFSNGVGNGRWTINNTIVAPPPLVYQGANSAYINRVQAGSAGNITENYLATPLVTVPTNGQLRFWTRTFTQGNQGTFYDVKVAPGTANQTLPASYTINLATYTEDQLTLDPQGVQNNFNIYTEQIINFPASLIGTQVYIAFVRRNTQAALNTIDGDRWLVDAVQLNERCLDPTLPTTAGIFSGSANLTWTNPSGATTWEIEVLPAATAFTGFGVVYSGALPYLATTTSYSTPLIQTALTPNTAYKYRVRAICPGNIPSDWSVGHNFTTTTAPPVCGGNFVDPGGPTTNYANNITAANGTTVICPVNAGDQVTVTFTNFATQANVDILSVYDGNSSAAPLLGNFSGTTLPPTFTSTATNGCLTFVFVSSATVTAAGWIANVTCAPPPPCPKPSALTVLASTPTSINLGWTSTGPATSWEYVILPCGSPLPTAATVGIPAPTNPFLITTGLASGTCYNIYVRSNCTSTANGISAWSNVLVYTTPIAPPVCGGNFVDSGGTAGSYSADENTTVTICPTIPGEEVTVTFTSFNTEATFDGMYVYNGNSTAAPLIASTNPAGNVGGPLTLPGAYWGAVIPGPFTGSNASGCLTFVFQSDDVVNNPGWLANVTCAVPPACARPISLTSSAVTFNSVSLGWTSVGVATGWQVIALPCTAPPPNATTTGWTPTTSNPFVISGLAPATCYNLYVRGDCSSTNNGVSLWSGPVSITTLVAPPVCGGQFYDLGGANGTYPNNANSTVTICPTVPGSGELVTVTFTTFNTEAQFDGLYVYDSNVVAPGALLATANPAGFVPGGLAGSYWGNLTGANLPGPFTSTHSSGCLTFVFRSDGSVINPGWVANITCAPAPTCARPIAVTPIAITQTSATISWTQPLNPDGSLAGAWEILILPAGSPVPTTPGIPATSPYLAPGLAPGTAYVFYVRAICSSTDSSTWAALPFATIPLNDECINATFAIVNQNLNCVQTTPGTLAGATGSLPVTNCPGVANDDVWFTFTATASTHVISFNNVSLPAPALNYAIFQGTSCGSLTQVGCNTGAGLTAGTTYYIRVYSATAIQQFTTFNLCIGTLPCTEAPAFCTGQTVTYANATNVPSLGQIGCLFTSPNPAFFFLQVNQAGPLSYLISQVDTGGVPRDVDYVAWGPFTDLTTACSGVPANPLPGLQPALTPAQGCGGTLHACSYSAAPTEIMCIPNAQLCQVYVIMITNFSNQAGTVTFTQTNTGGGTTECFPINTFNYPQTYYCQNSPNTTPVLAPGAANGTYTATPAGLSINPTTGTINVAASAPGAYIITSTTLTSTGGVCSNIPSITTTRTVIITAPASATISYASPSYCKSITASQNVIITGTPGGTYSASPSGLLINANTGAILPIASTPGLYTVTYTVPATGGCPAFTTTTQVEILNSISPTFTQVAAICPGDALAPLPTTSNGPNPVTGTWSPALNNMATTTYTFTPTAGVCASTTIMTISVGTTTPTFTQVAPICAGDNLAPLPTTSNNNVAGTWSPAINNLATTTYTFTPSIAQCASVVTMTIVVNPGLNVTVNSSSICLGQTATVTATPTVPGNYNYVWTVPAGVTNPGNVASFTTTVAGNYTVVISLVNTNTLCNLSFESPTATGAFPNLINQNLVPCWSTSAPDGIIEVWPTGFEAPPYGGNQLIEMNGNSVANIFQDFVVNPGTTLSITFAHRGRQGNDTVRVEIGPTGGPFVNLGDFTDGNSAWALHTVVHSIPLTSSSNYTIRFVSVSSAGGSPSVGNLLDAISVNVLTGCPSVPTTGTVTIIPFTVPTFAPIANICLDQTAPSLPTSSTNLPVAITGSWSPNAITTSALGTTTYTFTPDAGQCASSTTLDVTIVAPSIVPTFTPIANICLDQAAPSLPTSSTNLPVAISGSWSPSTIDTSVVGTVPYTFTPNAGQCAVTTTMNVTIVAPSIVPTFNAIAPICLNGTAPTLPTTSTNLPVAITGSWSPSTIDTSVAGTTTYTFTPFAAQCAVTTTMNVTIVAPTVATFTQIGPLCQGSTAPALPSVSSNSPTTVAGSWSPATISTATPGTTTYTFTPNTGLCATGTTMDVTIHPTPVLNTINDVFVCDSYTLPALGAGAGNYFSQPNGQSPITNLTLTTNQTVYVFVQSNTTPACTDEEIFTVNLTASPQFSIVGSCVGSNYTLQVVNANFNTDTATYVWSGPATILNNGSSSIQVTTPGVYTCTVSVVSGTGGSCTNPVTFNATEISCEIPKGISPNGDGLNDTFDLSGFNVGKLGIFNRYGKTVYSKLDYKDEWGGQSDSGNELPDGTYYYVIERKDGGETRTGWIYINREKR